VDVEEEKSAPAPTWFFYIFGGVSFPKLTSKNTKK
jgi:hypothetical protein